MKWICQSLLTLVAIGGILCCGSSSPSTPTLQPTPTPIPPPPIVVTQGSSAVRAKYFWEFPFSIAQAGTLKATVNWTFATNLMWTGIAPSSCTVAAYQAFTCNFLVFDTTPAPTPTKVLTLPNLSPGSYVVLVDNRGPQDDSFSYQVILSPNP